MLSLFLRPYSAPTQKNNTAPIQVFLDKTQANVGRLKPQRSRQKVSQPLNFSLPTSIASISTNIPPVKNNYIDAWKAKVERLGRMQARYHRWHYPEASNVRLSVAIDKDGQLQSVVLLESSGEKTLDEAALHLVQLAAPYAPTPFGETIAFTSRLQFQR